MKFYNDERDFEVSSYDLWQTWKSDSVLWSEYENDFCAYVNSCTDKNGTLELNRNKEYHATKVETNVALPADEARELKRFLTTIGVEWHSTEYFELILVLPTVSVTERVMVDEWLTMYTK